jgi:hypothetical protein
MAVTEAAGRSSHLKRRERGHSIVTKRQDLKKKYATAAELRTEKVDKIRQLLAISPDPGDEEAVKFIAQWRETGQVPVSAQLKTKVRRLLHEWHSIHMTCIEIQNELDPLDKAATLRQITAAE